MFHRNSKSKGRDNVFRKETYFFQYTENETWKEILALIYLHYLYICHALGSFFFLNLSSEKKI